MKHRLIGISLTLVTFMLTVGFKTNPAITYVTSSTIDGKKYSVVAVCDSDATNQTVIYTPSSDSYISRSPSWSPDGGTISIMSQEGSNGDKIYLCDVSDSLGNVVGRNTRQVFSASGIRLYGVNWSSVSSTAKIAFITKDNSSGICTVYVISPSGGTPTVLYQSPSGEDHTYQSPTWSPDDSKIAFTDRTFIGSSHFDTLRVINASTGALLESVDLGSPNVQISCEWSRTGLNVVAFGFDGLIYYVTPTTGSTPWTNDANIGGPPTWSPDNSSILSGSAGASLGLKKTAYGTTTATVLADTGVFGFPEWKKNVPTNNGVRGGMPYLSSFTSSPNPFTANAKLHFALNRMSYVTIEVYDLLGNKVFSNAVRSYDAGSYEILLDGKTLPQGILNARISTRFGEVQTVKLVKEQ